MPEGKLVAITIRFQNCLTIFSTIRDRIGMFRIILLTADIAEPTPNPQLFDKKLREGINVNPIKKSLF